MLAVTTLLPLIVGIPTARWTLGRVDSVMDQLEYGRAFSLGHAMAHMVASGLLAGQDWDEFPPLFRGFGLNERGLLYAVLVAPEGNPVCEIHNKDYSLNIDGFRQRTAEDFSITQAHYRPVTTTGTPVSGRWDGVHRWVEVNFLRRESMYYSQVAMPVGQPPLAYLHFGLDVTASQELLHSLGFLLFAVPLLIALAGSLLVLTMHRRPFGSSAQRTLQAEALLEVSRTLLSAESLDTVLDHIVFHIAEVLNPNRVCLLLVNEISGRLDVKASRGIGEPLLAAIQSDTLKNLLIPCVNEGSLVSLEGIRQHPNWTEVESSLEHPLRCFEAVPLRARDRCVGVLLLFRDAGARCTHDEIKYLETFSHLAALAIEHSSLLAQSSMVQEVHHRVKNNLQDVANLLSLEMRRVDDPQARHSLENTLNRLKGMSVAYDLLARISPNAAELVAPNLKVMIQALADEVWAPMVPVDKLVTFRVLGDDLRVPPRKATTIGMVVNELATNALQHGLGQAVSGSIEVRLRCEEESGRATICVEDDGVGLPNGFDPRGCARLGLTIAMTLVERDLGGHLTYSNGERTRAEISLLI